MCKHCKQVPDENIEELREPRYNIKRDSKLIEEYLAKGLTMQQIYDLDLAIEVTMDLPEYHFRIVLE